MKRTLKKFASCLPKRLQQRLKRAYFGAQIRSRRFRTGEPEYVLLPDMISPGDWVLDIGANIGHYTVRFSELVGDQGRVISFEPVPDTFELLAANVALLPNRNITLINAAASDATKVVGIEIPKFLDTGLDNYYTAHLSDASSKLNVLCIALDFLSLPPSIRLVKIDAEGHEMPVLRGMRGLLERDRPILIVEDNTPEVLDFLRGLGYSHGKIEGSSNCIFRMDRSNGGGA
jgi:FkbM family methyltransferase